MAVHARKVDLAGGPVQVEIFAGNLHVFSYRALLMDANGSNQLEVMSGSTIDTLPDLVTLADPPAKLTGRFLAVDGLLSPITRGKKQNFNLNIHVRQGGVPIGGGPVTVTGQLTTTIPILEHIQL